MKLAKLNNEAEIFLSIQGEGRSIGQPSIFVRSSLCNLHCVWCDTDYTWNWQGTHFVHQRDREPGYAKYDPRELIIELSPGQIVERIRKFECRRVVLTGGEPMLHQDEWVEVMRQLRAYNTSYWFEVETNGTLRPIAEFDALIDQYNVSAKLANAGMPEHLRLKDEPLRWLAAQPKAWFKFVVAQPADLNEVLTLIRKYSIAADHVQLMPEGTNARTLTERQTWLADICSTHGFTLTDRLHVRIWGPRRGV